MTSVWGSSEEFPSSPFGFGGVGLEGDSPQVIHRPRLSSVTDGDGTIGLVCTTGSLNTGITHQAAARGDRVERSIAQHRKALCPMLGKVEIVLTMKRILPHLRLVS